MGNRRTRLIWHVSGAVLLLLTGPWLLGIGGSILGSKFASLFFAEEREESHYRSLAVELMLENAELRELAAKTRVYRSMLSFTRMPEVNAVAGRVLFRSEGLIRGDLIIDRGSFDGVLPGDVCITDRGLVGVVAEVEEATATVKPITSPAVQVSCITAESGSLGILSSDSDGNLRLMHVDVSSDPVPGETVLTSRFGGVYPEGIVVGTVSGVSQGNSGFDLSLSVTASVDFDRVDEALILLKEGDNL